MAVPIEAGCRDVDYFGAHLTKNFSAWLRITDLFEKQVPGNDCGSKKGLNYKPAIRLQN